MTTASMPLESDVFTIKPSLKDRWGTILVGIITIPIGLGILILLLTWLSVKSISYRMTNQRLFLKSGIVARRVQEAELYRIKDVEFTQGIIQRVLGVGHVTVISSDATTPVLTLKSIRNPEQTKEAIRAAFRSARKSEGVKVAEHAH